MKNPFDQSDINAAAWEACNIFRGAMDPFVYKDYILATLFWKYMSDVWAARKEEIQAKYRGDEKRQNRNLERERFFLPEGSTFKDVFGQRSQTDLGGMINAKL